MSTLVVCVGPYQDLEVLKIRSTDLTYTYTICHDVPVSISFYHFQRLDQI